MVRNNIIYLFLAVAIFALMGEAEGKKSSKKEKLPALHDVLKLNYDCSSTITVRAQALDESQVQQICKSLRRQEQKFHRLFGTRNKPVRNDYNNRVRINVYNSRAEYHKFAGAHFNIPTNNGGMYLEGMPSNKDNEAEFIAFEENGVIRNLQHEYIHYLSGRFNVYGDFCAMPHDSHSPPENCPEPHPPYPHMVWWEEGMAEYASTDKIEEKFVKLARRKAYKLSELFDSSYIENSGDDRVYRWCFLAVKFLFEKHREKVEEMLSYTRVGDWNAYRKLIGQWGTALDDEFSAWLDTIEVGPN